MPAPGRPLGDRDRYSDLRIAQGAGCGCLLSFLLMAGLLPLREILQESHTVLGALCWCGTATVLGCFCGAWLTRLLTSGTASRRLMIRWLVGGMSAGAIFSCFPLLGVLWEAYVRGAGFGLGGGLPALAVFTIASWVGVGTFFGLAIGEKAAMKLEAEEHERLKAQLDEQRRALEDAIAKKFGPLDDVLRERIRAWDEGHLAEAKRRLDDAKTPDDLE
jgi:hypothetical protein